MEKEPSSETEIKLCPICGGTVLFNEYLNLFNCHLCSSEWISMVDIKPHKHRAVNPIHFPRDIASFYRKPPLKKRLFFLRVYITGRMLFSAFLIWIRSIYRGVFK